MNATARWMGMCLLTGITLQSWNAHGVVAGQIDDFEDGTTQGWVVSLLGQPHPQPPQNVVSGGPAGIDDNYLLLTSIGGGPIAGSKLSVINFNSQWSGDYLSSGIALISMDLRNFGDTDLSLRLLFGDPTVGPPENVAVSTTPILLSAGAGWTSVSFSIDPADLTAVDGDVTTALANATELRIFHSTTATFPGESVVSQLGVDNIRAVAKVPDLSSTGLLSVVGLMGLAALGRRVRV